MKGIIAASCWPIQSSLLWMSQTTNMSRETNGGVMMHVKKITMDLLTIVHPLVEPTRSLAKTKASLDASFPLGNFPEK